MKIERKVFIPKRTPSLNEWKGEHWSVYHKIKKNWKNILALLLQRGEHRDRFRYMSIKVYHRQESHFYDRDNREGGAKPVIDIIKDLGWIKDDDETWMYCWYDQGLVGEDGSVEEGTHFIFYEQIYDALQTSFIMCKKCLGDLFKKLFPFRAEGGTCFLCGEIGTVILSIQEIGNGRGKKKADKKA